MNTGEGAYQHSLGDKDHLICARELGGREIPPMTLLVQTDFDIHIRCPSIEALRLHREKKIMIRTIWRSLLLEGRI